MAPVPDEVGTIARTLGHARETDEPVVNISGSTVYLVVCGAANELESVDGVDDVGRRPDALWDEGYAPPSLAPSGSCVDVR